MLIRSNLKFKTEGGSEAIRSMPFFHLTKLAKTLATNNFGDSRILSLINETICNKNLREGSNII